ncbi:MAG: DUF2070 family protein [Candidatus Bathyarchaeota archaeon]|nr:MAG: DUF2070 family protein [Candidatus Bathyarchaeota archaeon]
MSSAKNLEYSIDRAVKHYSSLFVLPSHRKVALLTFLLCIIGGTLAVFPFTTSTSGMILALQFSLLFFSFSSISDVIIRQVFMKSDPIFNTRRCAALSAFSILLWFGFLLIGSLLAFFTGSWGLWIDLFSIGFVAVCILRLVVFSSTSFASYGKALGAALLQPILCLPPLFWTSYYMNYRLTYAEVAYFPLSIPIAILTVFVFIQSVDKVGMEAFQTPTVKILKAFLANWMEDLVAPVENLFESFGKRRTIDFSLLAFKAENKIKSLTVVSSFHPGPFKNVGSSLLPFMLQRSLEKKLNCVVAVPHGLYGHEFDLFSQNENQKVLTSVLESTEFTQFSPKATRLVRTQKGVASGSCQIFGDCAVFTLTLAPETTEDFPQEIGDMILKKASQLGLKHVIIINAHNSINDPFDTDKAVDPLKEVALEAMHRTSKFRPSPFKIGISKALPKEFSLEDGMGPGGISVLTIKVGNQTCAYITIDGNNMVSGLREKILGALKEVGVDEGEVLTTDTHAVNAVVLTDRGYHPLGEAISHEKLTDYIKCLTMKAIDNMMPASVAWFAGQVPDVGVIGESQIRELSNLADKALQQAKKSAVLLLTAVSLLFVGLLILL